MEKNLITEDYVSFETALLLKEKGFNVPVRTFYNPKYRGEKVSDGTALINYNADPEDGNVLCSAPTLQMALKWLREKCELIIEIDYNNDIECDENERWGFSWYLRPHYEVNLNTYATNEEATEAAIKYCLTNLTI